MRRDNAPSERAGRALDNPRITGEWRKQPTIRRSFCHGAAPPSPGGCSTNGECSYYEARERQRQIVGERCKHFASQTFLSVLWLRALTSRRLARALLAYSSASSKGRALKGKMEVISWNIIHFLARGCVFCAQKK